ncbi:MAG: hypothetical protein AB1782_16825 [Cyanobacteriota bacterium]
MTLLASLGQRLTPKNVTLGVIMTNMVCRPTITLSNKQIPEETRRYTATREFFTELFGLASTFTFATAVEKFVPKIIAKKFFNTELTQKLMDQIKNTGWDKLTAVQKNLRGVILGSSFVATALAVAIITPLINNIVLNKMLGKIMGKKTQESSQNNNDVFVNSQNNKTSITFETNSDSFNNFVKLYNASLASKNE